MKRKEISNENVTDILSLTQEAGQAILKIFNQDNIHLNFKSDRSPVTNADLISNKIISEGLKKITPLIPIISEETRDFKIKPNFYWLVDPLDGTREFIEKRNEFTVNIALIVNKTPVLGFIDAPALNVSYFGTEQMGSIKIHNSKSTRIQIKTNDHDSKTLKVAVSRNHLDRSTIEFLNNIKQPYEILPFGSSLKFCLIAEGLADLYPRLAPTSSWDTAAGHAILNFAGGSVKKINGDPLSYSKSKILNSGFLAATNNFFRNF
jgi:3'(2'), 5'-bisphosphate nucleotidase